MAYATAKRKRKSVGKHSIKPSGRTVYSYKRFSDVAQEHGRSEGRQTDKAREWAERHGHSLDTSLRVDRGRSAFHGEHRKRGYLGEFLKRVEAGKIARGSILLVEEVRRLSREGSYVGLKETVNKLFDAGITIQFLEPEHAFDIGNINQAGQMPLLTMLLDMAFAESKQKSEWLSDVWKNKRSKARDHNEIATAMCPAWLKIVGRKMKDGRVFEAGTFEPIREAVKTIRSMFRWKEKGLSYIVITNRLNAEALWAPSEKCWGVSYVKKVLRNRAVIGELQPHKKIGGRHGKRVPDGQPIPDYYPAIVDAGLFHRVQRMLNKSRGKSAGGRNDKCSNVLTRLVKCAYCGGPMHMKNDGEDRFYLYCYNSRRGTSDCDAPQIPYGICEQVVIDQCREIRPEQVLPKKDQQTKLCIALRRKVGQTQALMQETEKEIKNYKLLIGRHANSELQDEFVQELTDRKQKIEELELTLEQQQKELEKAERAERGFAQWKADVESLQAVLDKGSVEVRQRLNAQLCELIDRIEVFSAGRGIDDGDDFRAYVDAADDEADQLEFHRWDSRSRMPRDERTQVGRFVDWTIAMRRTKRGRFLRIHLKLSETRVKALRENFGPGIKTYIDVYPEGSIGGRCSIGPLWDEFKKTTRKRTPR